MGLRELTSDQVIYLMYASKRHLGLLPKRMLRSPSRIVGKLAEREAKLLMT